MESFTEEPRGGGGGEGEGKRDRGEGWGEVSHINTTIAS